VNPRRVRPPAPPPTVTTLAATSVTSTSARLNGSANPNLSSTTGWFRYSTSAPGSCDDAFGTRAPSSGGTPLGTDGSAVAYSETIGSLTPGVTYFFCAIAESSAGKTFGAVLSFATPEPLIGSEPGDPLDFGVGCSCNTGPSASLPVLLLLVATRLRRRRSN
jgi:uncharacterized protein (TIGR03382 family)